MPELVKDIGISLGGLAVGLSLMIAGKYARKVFARSNGSRLLPIHVVVIAIAFSALLAVAMNEIGRSTATFYTYLAVFGASLGAAALVIVTLHLRKLGPHPDVVVDERASPLGVDERRRGPDPRNRRTWPTSSKVLLGVSIFSLVLTASLIVFASVAIQAGNEERRNLLEEVKAVAEHADNTAEVHRESALKQHCSIALLETFEGRELSSNERKLIRKACTH